MLQRVVLNELQADLVGRQQQLMADLNEQLVAKISQGGETAAVAAETRQEELLRVLEKQTNEQKSQLTELRGLLGECKEELRTHFQRLEQEQREHIRNLTSALEEIIWGSDPRPRGESFRSWQKSVLSRFQQIDC